MRPVLHSFAGSLAIASLLGCHSVNATWPAGEVTADGVVRWQSFEGGFYSLETARDHFDPMNLPAEYRQDGLRVHFVGTVRRDMGSTHLYGQILEITAIRRR